MGQLVILAERRRDHAEAALRRAALARDSLDSRGQRAHAEHACRLFESVLEADERTVAGLLKATELELDARAAHEDYSGATDRAERTREWISEHGSGWLARERGLRHIRRCQEVGGGADSAMRESMSAYHRLRLHPESEPDHRQRESEMLVALTMVVSAAHRTGTQDALSFGRRALDLADRSIAGDPSVHSAVGAFDPCAAARFSMWAGLFTSGSLRAPEDACRFLSAYATWCARNPTKRVRLLEPFARGEMLLAMGQEAAARDVFRRTLDETAAILPRKYRAAQAILERRGVV